MAGASSTRTTPRIVGHALGTVAALAVGGVAIAAMSLWHWAIAVPRAARRALTGHDDRREDADDPDLVEYELGWYRYVRAFDAHHGPDGSPDREPDSGSFRRGLRIWIGTRLLRGYTLDNEVYVCPNAPRVLRVHQAGHAPAFGRDCETLVRPRRENGGLDDEPLRTLDVMMPGDFPHTLLRFRDPRGLGKRYGEWLREGRIARVTG